MTRRIELSTGVELEILEAGQGGRPLLLVHGFTGGKEDFGDHLNAIAAAGWHVVAPDTRGHGGSSKPERLADYSLELYAGDVVALADELGWDRFVLLGHSMGGMIVQVVAIDHVDRLDGLVLMDTHHGLLDIDPDLVGAATHIAETQGIRALFDAMAAAEGPLDTPAHVRVTAERPGYQEFNDGKLLASSPAMYAAMARTITSNPSRLDALRSVRVPTLVIVGEQDKPFLDASREMADAIDGARLDIIDDAGHSPQFENPSGWLASLSGFLSTL